jgi:hypothetical protein
VSRYVDPPVDSADARDRAELGDLVDEDERPRRTRPRPWWASSAPRLPEHRRRWWADQCRAAIAAARLPASGTGDERGQGDI